MQPALDVVIPCYNAEGTLRRAAESAVRQKPVQTVWLIDDASSDGTAVVMAELAAEFPDIIRCEYLPQNGGVSRARNWGLLQSSAEFTAFLDADDEYENGALDAAHMALSHYPYLGLVRLKLAAVGLPERYAQHENLPAVWRQLEMTVGGNTVFRRSLLLAAGGFPQDKLFCQFGGEDGALGIAFTRANVVGTLFAPESSGVRHYCRDGMHAERLLDAGLFGVSDPHITEAHRLEAEAVTQRICNALAGVKANLVFGQTGITELTAEYG
ncbi:glycosyltransferase family 2 protein [Neisseria sp.]|uniref:glycosyltransferase family 2 protein n=1 Tax=Neisseria sp. TaxID=192066 RepID=UPI0035A0936C